MALYKTLHLPGLEKLRILLEVFTQARTSRAIDPRDRVYGLLGICDSYFDSAFGEPNYELDTASVYTAFAR